MIRTGLLLFSIATCHSFADRSSVWSQEERRDRESSSVASEREGGIPRSQVPSSGPDEATEEGQPNVRMQPEGGPGAQARVQPQVVPRQGRWRLGVTAYNTDTGVVVTRSIPGTPASRIGLERGDRIVAVSGFQVGWIDDRLYPLGDELQRRGGPGGRVQLLVQNVRNQELLILEVRLEPRGRDRFRTR